MGRKHGMIRYDMTCYDIQVMKSIMGKRDARGKDDVSIISWVFQGTVDGYLQDC